VLVAGESRPLDCVVKLDARLYLPPTEHLKEWLAAVIAAHLGVVVPEPFEVTVSPALADAVEDSSLRSALRRQRGPGSARRTRRSARPAMGWDCYGSASAGTRRS
jgi:hypothetical protein